MRRLTNSELNAAREILTGDKGEQVRLSVFDLALGKAPRGGNAVMAELNRLGWVANGVFTDLGKLLRDPIREYGFWVERERRLPSEDTVPVLQRERFKDKRVLELGSGGGCNLFSLMNIPGRLTGLEPMPVYLQIGTILSEVAGLPEPEVIEGCAEQIPLPDASYDVVICYSSHQYMDIDKAISEMARVLAPGGELIVVGNSLGPFIRETISDFLTSRQFGRTKFNTVAIINTLTYQLFGQRLIRDNTGTTATPIYPSRRYMLGRLKKEGLMWRSNDTCTVDSGETVLVATRQP